MYKGAVLIPRAEDPRHSGGSIGKQGGQGTEDLLRLSFKAQALLEGDMSVGGTRRDTLLSVEM